MAAESGHFWSIRSRRLWQAIGGGGALVFVVLGVQASASHSAAGLEWDSVCLLFCVVIFANAFRTGHLRLTNDGLVYQAVFRNRRFRRGDIKDARIEERMRFPSPRTFNMPVLVTSSGKQIPLVEINTPLSSSAHVLKAIIEVDGSPERSRQSLDGLAFWIQAWIASDDWIEVSQG